MQEYILERSEKKSCEDASDERVIRNIRMNVVDRMEMTMVFMIPKHPGI